ncbi:hypothetical protein PMG11_05400 [Penicillium brasilianum]|uniref:Uncharacterized protein n=1 Tax=Penicillium brasilianum TaxID=104259 RepID=A0A0F7VK77_PENBI|nr:hypothetical protein PMG11_05400 [Penicillium brasilianum]
MTAQANTISESIYHVMLMVSPPKASRGQIEKIRVLGTYTSIGKAKDAAHRGLFDSGYEREWFSTFETKPEALEELAASEGVGLAVYAVASDGTKFRLRISTSPNDLALKTDNEDGRVAIPLYYVVQTNVPYCSHERKPTHDTHIEGVFKSYKEAGMDERDCEFGENVVVHAIGSNEENYFLSVVTGQELESVRLAEASLKI